MVHAPPTTPTTPEPPVMCVSCGYALAGLADDGVCPECATSVAQSIAARRTQFPSAFRLSPARRALVALLVCAIAVPLLVFGLYLSFFIVRGNGLLIPVVALIAIAWIIWQGAWWTLATHDPTLAAGLPLPKGNRVLRATAAFSVAFTVVVLILATTGLWMRIGPLVGGTPMTTLWRAVFYAVPFTLVLVQVIAGAPLLARCAIARAQRSRSSRAPHRRSLRRTAMLALLLTSVATILGGLAGYLPPTPTVAPGSVTPGQATIFVVRGYLYLGLFVCMLALLAQLLAALFAAHAGVKRALEEWRLQARIAPELAAGRNP